MIRMNRAGRERSIKWVLQCARRKDKTRFLTVGEIARRLGLKSSTYLKNILRNMSNEDDEIVYAKWDGVDKWKFQPYEQTSFLDREIKINGQSRKVASWVADFQAAQS